MKASQGQLRIYTGGFDTYNTAQGKNAQKQNRHSVAGMFQRQQNTTDKVEQKKAEARKKAMKFVKDAFAADKSIDDDLAQRADRIKDSKAKIEQAQKELRGFDEQQKAYMERYGITEDSQEQKDLELLRKRRDSLLPDSKEVLTDEEKERLKEIDANGLTEYQKLSLENDSYRSPYETEIKENQKIVIEEQVIMREIGLERLKTHTMADAVQEKDDLMAAANKEIIGIIMDDAKDKVDQDMDETKEEIADKKEEAKEEQERIEEIQRRAHEMEETTEKRKEKNTTDISDLVTDRILELDAVKSDISQQVNDMLLDMKLLTEDLKGSVVDTEA